MAWLIGLPAEVQSFFDSTFGGFSPLVTLIVVILINSKVQEIRREQEGKAAAAAGKAISEAAERKVNSVSPEQWQKLAFCILIDVLGDSSYALPGLGESVDTLYAPLEALLLSYLFKSNAISAIGFAEEILPFTDAIPTATLAWTLECLFPDSIFARLLGIQLPEEEDLRPPNKAE